MPETTTPSAVGETSALQEVTARRYQDYGENPLQVRRTDQYVEEYTSGFVDKWDELIDWPARAASEGHFFIDVLKERGAKRILDVSTGTGFHSVRLINEGFEVVSADGSAEIAQDLGADALRLLAVPVRHHVDREALVLGPRERAELALGVAGSAVQLAGREPEPMAEAARMVDAELAGSTRSAPCTRTTRQDQGARARRFPLVKNPRRRPTLSSLTDVHRLFLPTQRSRPTSDGRT